MTETASDRQLVCLNKMCLLMSKILLARNLRRRCSSLRRQNALGDRIGNLYRTRKIYSRLCEERLLHLKMLSCWVQAHTFRSGPAKRPSQWYEKIVKATFADPQWLKYFKMRKKTFLDIVEELEPHLSHTELAADKKVAVALLALSSGKKIESVAQLFGIPRHNVASAIREVCRAIIDFLLPQVIKVPVEETLQEYIEDFENKWGFPQCAGILNSIHIPIRMSKLPENATDYINNDGGYSMYLQGIVDPTYKFWDINVGWPGSVKESRVLTTSEFWNRMQDGKLFPSSKRNISGTDVPIYILAGSSYPLTEWLMRPFQVSGNSSPEELKFNEAFKFAQGATEIAFKRLKARWNCLAVGNVCSIDNFPNVVTACCVLHNICESSKEPLLDEWIVKAESLYRQPLPFACCSVVGSEAQAIQQALKSYVEQH